MPSVLDDLSGVSGQKVPCYAFVGVFYAALALLLQLTALIDPSSVVRWHRDGGRDPALGVWWKTDDALHDLYWDDAECGSRKAKALTIQAFSIVCMVFTGAMLIVYVVAATSGSMVVHGPLIAQIGNPLIACLLVIPISITCSWYSQDHCGVKIKDMQYAKLGSAVPAWAMSCVSFIILAALGFLKVTETFGPMPLPLTDSPGNNTRPRGVRAPDQETK